MDDPLTLEQLRKYEAQARQIKNDHMAKYLEWENIWWGFCERLALAEEKAQVVEEAERWMTG